MVGGTEPSLTISERVSNYCGVRARGIWFLFDAAVFNINVVILTSSGSRSTLFS